MSHDYFIAVCVAGGAWLAALLLAAMEYGISRESAYSDTKKVARVFLAILFLGPIAALAWPLTLGLAGLVAIVCIVRFFINIVRDALGKD